MKNPGEQIEEYIECLNRSIHEAFNMLEQNEVPDISAMEIDIKLMLDTFQFLKLEESMKYKTEVASIIEKIQSVKEGIAVVLQNIKDEINQINRDAAAVKPYEHAANDNG